MKKTSLSAVCLAIFAGLLFWLNPAAQAAPAAQYTPFPTPTPDADGRIIYVVQPRDTLWRISAITGVTLDQLRALNNLGANDQIVEGQQLLLALAEPVRATTTPLAPFFTPTAAFPAPTPQPGSGTLCVLVYNDGNGDSIRQEEELSIPGGAISISDRAGKTSLTETTVTGSAPLCFKELTEGEYNISVAAPDGYNPTTVMNYTLKLEAGAETYLDFGAQPGSKQLAELPAASAESKSPLLGILGGLVLLSGVGLAVFSMWLVRKGGKASGE